MIKKIWYGSCAPGVGGEGRGVGTYSADGGAWIRNPIRPNGFLVCNPPVTLSCIYPYPKQYIDADAVDLPAGAGCFHVGYQLGGLREKGT